MVTKVVFTFICLHFGFQINPWKKFYGLSIVYSTSVKDLEKLENQFTLLNGRH